MLQNLKKYWKWVLGLFIFIGIISGYLNSILDVFNRLKPSVGKIPANLDASVLPSSVIASSSAKVLGDSVYDIPSSFLNMTGVEIEIRSEKYKDMEVKTSGYLVQANPSVDGFSVMFTKEKKPTPDYYIFLFCHFDKKWRENISVLKVGERINVSGKIEDVSENSVSLNECNLI